MRCFFSITTIAALMSSLISPLLAATCSHMQQPVACHRVQAQKPACAMMHHHEAEEPAPGSGAPAFESMQSPERCPMDCCVPGQRTNAIAIAAVSPLPELAVTEQNLHFVPAVFTRTGYSSHTDRGPPAS